MTATDQLRTSAKNLLPANLPSNRSSSESELDLRFLETSEAFILALVLDPNAPYYLAKLVTSEVLSGLRNLVSAATEIINVLNSPAEKLEAPAKDRHFSLMEDSLARIGDRVALGSSPEAEDIASFEQEATIFARAQLVPQEVAVSTESFLSRLNAAIASIDDVLPDLLVRLNNLAPATFFVDDLPATIPKAKQLTIFVQRIRDVMDRHSLWLESNDVNVRVSNSSQMLAETATMISTLSLLNNLASLQYRFRSAGPAQFVSAIAGELYGTSTPAKVVGQVLPGPVLPIPTAAVLEVDVDLDAAGAVVTALSVTLPVATVPADVVVSAADWTFTPGISVVSLQSQVVKDTTDVNFYGTFVVIPVYANFVAANAASPATGDYAHLLDNSALSDGSGVPETFSYNGATWDDHTVATEINVDDPYGNSTGYTVTLEPEDLDGLLLDVRNDMDGSDATTEDFADMFTIVGDNTGATLTIALKSGTWRNVGDDIYAAVTIEGTRQLSTGTSPTLTDVIDDINTQGAGIVTATALGGRRMELKSDLSGADVSSGNSSALTVTTQPLTGATPILGLPTAQALGSATVLYDPAADFLTAGIASGLQVTDGSYALLGTVAAVIDDTKLLLQRPIAATTQEQPYLVYALGALSYRDNVETQATLYGTASAALLPDTETLKDLLSQAIFSSSDRVRAKNYIYAAVGNPDTNSGPAYDLLGILSTYESPESRALTSALSMLRERGFDKMVATLLLGNVGDALQETNASYAKTVREVIDRSGMNNLL